MEGSNLIHSDFISSTFDGQIAIGRRNVNRQWQLKIQNYHRITAKDVLTFVFHEDRTWWMMMQCMSRSVLLLWASLFPSWQQKPSMPWFDAWCQWVESEQLWAWFGHGICLGVKVRRWSRSAFFVDCVQRDDCFFLFCRKADDEMVKKEESQLRTYNWLD